MTDSLYVAAAAQHPITPPQELVEQWVDMFSSHSDHAVFSLAARWGADIELEACCEWLRTYGHTYEVGLRASRRPKPPSLKEQALARTDAILNDSNHALLIEVREILELNRRALEQLDD